MVLALADKPRRLTEMNELHVIACKPMGLSKKRLGPNLSNTDQTTAGSGSGGQSQTIFMRRFKRVGCPRQLCAKLWINP